MDRFSDKDEPHRLDDPEDVMGAIIGDGEGIGGAVIDLRNALVVEGLTVAEIDGYGEEEGPKAYGLLFTGRKPTGEEREMMTILDSHGCAQVVMELARVAAHAHDDHFLAAMMGIIGGDEGLNGSPH